MSVFFLFLDGVGVGDPGPFNPLDRHLGFLDSFSQLPKSHSLCRSLDANLDVEGLPQSGSGQTALFTGVNVARSLGRHFGPYPHSSFKPVLDEKGLFKQWLRSGQKAEFINAFPEGFLEWCERKKRWATISYMVKSAGLDLNGVEKVGAGEAVTAEITQKVWKEKFYPDLEVITPDEASQRVVRRLEHTDLLLMEFYLTDKAGHTQSREKADEVLNLLDAFLSSLLSHMDLSRHTLLITSDHGNLEDLSVKTHTRNPVPLLVAGKSCNHFRSAESILDVTPLLLSLPKE